MPFILSLAFPCLSRHSEAQGLLALSVCCRGGRCGAHVSSDAEREIYQSAVRVTASERLAELAECFHSVAMAGGIALTSSKDTVVPDSRVQARFSGKITRQLLFAPALSPLASIKSDGGGSRRRSVQILTEGKERLNKQKEGWGGRREDGGVERATALTVSDVWFTLLKRWGVEITSHEIINMICGPLCRSFLLADRNVKMSEAGEVIPPAAECGPHLHTLLLPPHLTHTLLWAAAQRYTHQAALPLALSKTSGTTLVLAEHDWQWLTNQNVT
ncbi:hypothetical protein MHYP_G00197750 [Metynnis hypsauchen]